MESDETLQLVKSLSRLTRACSYYQVDLHIHSPDSSDYSGNKNISAKDFVANFVNRGVDLIAITDHNTGSYIDQAIEARNQIVAHEGKNITILPGVELYVSPGIHLLAILPEGGSAAISDLLSRLGLPVNQHGDITKLISQPIGDISRIIQERNGLLIGAHCNSTHGIVQELEGQPRIEWLRTVDALEINSGSNEEKITSTMNYVSNSLGLQIPFTFGSDSHDCENENLGMWVKMAEFNLTSLRQLIYEPSLRVSRTEPTAPSHGRIIGFTSTHGIYADERFRFSPNLNVLLGGRGGGKSAAIDLLRFAFGSEPKFGDYNFDFFKNRIAGFLRSVGEVLVLVADSEGDNFLITRSGAFETTSRRGSIDFSESPRVYQVTNEGLVEREVSPLELLGIEFYGQGEAARLASQVDEQMRLIDENLNHSESLSSISIAEKQLDEEEVQIISKKDRLELLTAEFAARPQIEEQRTRLSQSLEDPIFAERTRWDREQTWIREQEKWIQSSLESLPDTLPRRSDLSINLEESPARTVLEKIGEVSRRIFESSEIDLERLRNPLKETASELQELESEWNTAFKAADDRYRARLTELGAADLAGIAAEFRGVDHELARLDTSVKPEIKQLEREIATLGDSRKSLLKTLRDSRSKIASSRSDFVEELNSRLAGDVVVDLSSTDKFPFLSALDGALQGSGIQHREEQVKLVCDRYTPEEFVDIVRKQSFGKLVSIGITGNNSGRIVIGITEDVLYRIERIDVLQVPNIRIRREGETEYTDLHALSVGEKCSAILSIALLSKAKPLVIDQPEDDLDHAYIINSIVEGIRAAKSGRQIIVATHNPNIPVLGDAEMVFRVARRLGKDVCYILNSGGLEIPTVTAEVQGLEGGAEAFERRRQRYSTVS